MRLLITNIDQLQQVDLSYLETGVITTNKPISGPKLSTIPSLSNAWLLVENAFIHSYGSMNALPETTADKCIDASGKMVLPAWCDSHTHLVFAGPRDGEFVDRIKGLSYEEIAEELSLPLGTVKAQLFRARDFLATMMHKTKDSI